MADQKVMGDGLLKEFPYGPKALEKIFEMQQLFGSKFCNFKELSKGLIGDEDGTSQEFSKERVRWRDIFLDCIFDECSEILNWLPWKHWKAYTDFHLQSEELRFELIDVLHFIVSEYLLYGNQPWEIRLRMISDSLVGRPVAGGDSLKDILDFRKTFLADKLQVDITEIKRDEPRRKDLTIRFLRNIISNLGYLYNDTSSINQFTRYRAPDVLVFDNIFSNLFDLFILWDMNEKDIYNHYMSKNAENFDRQRRGY